MEAVKIQSPGQAVVVRNAKIPTVTPEGILVRVAAVALNPTDWKHIDMVSVPATVGCDFAGTLTEVGSEVTKQWAIGDRVCGFVHGSNVHNLDGGAFAQYVNAVAELQLRIPESMSYEAAATFGVGYVTVGQGLYQSLGLPTPDKPAPKPFPVLIYGGSSAMGSFGIQFAKLSGLEVITTCSPHNFDYVKGLGADMVLDYRSPNCGADIRKATNNALFYAWDTISDEKSAKICADALSSEPANPATGHKPQYGQLGRVTCPRQDVETKSTMAYTAVGKAINIGPIHVPAQPEHREYLKHFTVIVQKLLDQGMLKPLRQDARPGGLAGVIDGLKDLKSGKVSAAKVVYKVSEH